MSTELFSKDFKISDLQKKVENKFLLAAAVARRARQLKDGAKPLINISRDEILPVITALQEIHQDKIQVVLQAHKGETQEMLEKMDEELETELNKDEVKAQAESDEKAKENKKKSRSLAA